MKKRRYFGILCILLMFCISALTKDHLYADIFEDEPDNAEAAVAGAALTMDKYFGGEVLYNPEELLALLEEEKDKTDESSDSSEDITEPTQPTEPDSETTIEVPTETIPEITDTPLPPVTGYRGMAICKAANYSNVRSGPGTEAPVIGKIYNCAIAEVIDEVAKPDGIWFCISSGTVVGYVKADYFVIGDEALALYPQVVSKTGTVNAVNLRLRSTPNISVNNNILTKLAFGTKVAIAGEEGEFYLIELDEGYFGYLHKSCVDVEIVFKTALSLEEERIAKEKAEAALREAEEAARREEESRRAAEAAAQASKEAAEKASKEAAEKASKEAATTVAKITLRYVGPQKYAGDILNATELEITMHFVDGHTEKNLPGWGCATVGQALPEGEVKIVVVYGAHQAGMKITVLPVAQQPAQPQPPAETEAPTEAPTEPTAPTEPPVTVPEPTEPPVTVPPTTTPQPQPSEMDKLRLELCSYALQFVGNPYVYGGTSLTQGTDCSGFTMRVYEHFGIKITRTSRSQAVAGRQVSLDNIRPGDLLFYDTDGRITHVALYIGNGQIVHAANKQLGILVMDAFYRMPCKAVTFLDTP